MQILVVEDEKRLAEGLAQILSEQKYMVDIAFDGRDGLDYGLSGIYDMIILDIMLPKMNGYEVAAQLRKEKIATPILMLTAKDQIADKVKGLDAGADDYMTKPFAPEELLARVRALTRRQGEVVIDEITFNDLTLNLSTCDLSCDAKSVHLNFKEFEIMKILMQNPQVVTTKEDLIVKVWGYDSNAVDNNVEVYISFLRKKLDFISSRVEISSLRKIGYRLEVKDNA
ncbi:MAG: response regulator transcription factor [Ruminococcaceae bacterium]|nr:response regulator transcription factor [Oscillospiraceae bacterium]MBR3597590.1 response regulator transcription factor [Clostridia bacterium]